MDFDEKMMGRALELARRAWGATHPNPMVGAVLVEGGAVVAEGWHARDGGPHAERAALVALGRRPAPGATLYVTLEPCSTAGRTGACCELIREAGIARVVIGATDPNPAHAGRAVGLLRAAGIEVRSGVRAVECADLNLIFNHWIVSGRPLLAGKVATTRDGFSAPPPGTSRWITGEAARVDAHRWRRLFPGILVGAGTVRADNPALTRRWTEDGVEREECGRRFVFDPLLTTAAGAEATWPRLYTDRWRERTTVVATPAADAEARARLEAAGVGVWEQETTRGPAGWGGFARRCAAEGVTGVLIEGGATVLNDALAAGVLDYGFWYRAGFAGDSAWGGKVERWHLTSAPGARLGEDQLTRGRILA
jgi:diaminohydroxyphosphoribosylaminopyrimidine deaminase / 5-amino-6-(5-phosphoribosylamino)uracil reductase